MKYINIVAIILCFVPNIFLWANNWHTKVLEPEEGSVYEPDETIPIGVKVGFALGVMDYCNDAFDVRLGGRLGSSYGDRINSETEEVEWHGGRDFRLLDCAGNTYPSNHNTGNPINPVPVYAPYRGIVRRVQEMTSGFGNNIIIYFPDIDASFVYAHLANGPNYETGDTIEYDEIVGYAGNSGGSRGAHLHLTVMPGDKSNCRYSDVSSGGYCTDPQPYMFGHGQYPDSSVCVVYREDTVLYNCISDFSMHDFYDEETAGPRPFTYELELPAWGLEDGRYDITASVYDNDELEDHDNSWFGIVSGLPVFICQTGGSSVLVGTYIYTSDLGSGCQAYYDFYDFDNWGYTEISHIERDATEMTVRGAVFHAPWDDGLMKVYVLDGPASQGVRLSLTTVSPTQYGWEYTFTEDNKPYGFTAKASWMGTSIGGWPKARWARISEANTYLYQESRGCSGDLYIELAPAFIDPWNPWSNCDSLIPYDREMQRKLHQWGVLFNVQREGDMGYELTRISVNGHTAPEPPFDRIDKFLVGGPVYCSRYGGYTYPDAFNIDHLYTPYCNGPKPECDFEYKTACSNPDPRAPQGYYDDVLDNSFNYIAAAGAPPEPGVDAVFRIEWGGVKDIALALGAPEEFSITSGGGSGKALADAEAEQSKETELPTEYSLGVPRPNPFNTSVSFDIELPKTSVVDLRIYDVLGRLVDTPINHTEIPAGRFTENWSCANCASGTYFIVLQTEDFRQSRKMTMVK